MLGLKLAPAVVNTDFINALYGEGLLTVGAGDNVIRILPPLIITETEVREAMKKFAAVAKKIPAKTSALSCP